MKKILLIILFVFSSNNSFAQIFFNPNYMNVNKGTSQSKTNSKIEMKKLNEKIKKGSASEDDYIARGKLYMEKGQTYQAIQDFSEAIKLNNLSFSAYLERAEAYFESGNIFGANQDLSEIFDGVIADVSKGSFYNSLWKRAYTLRAKIHEKNGDYSAAESDYNSAEKF